jgi:hypothetical protein
VKLVSEDEKKPKVNPKHSWKNILIFLIGLILVIFLLLTFTQLPYGLPFFTPEEIPAWQEAMLVPSVILTILFVGFLFFYFIFKEKIDDLTNENKHVIVQKSDAEMLPLLRNHSRDVEINIGDYLGCTSEPAHGEASALPPTIYYKFELIERGIEVGVCVFRVNFVNKIVINLQAKYFKGRETHSREFTGESKEEVKRTLSESISLKKKKDMSQLEDEDEEEDESSTEL